MNNKRTFNFSLPPSKIVRHWLTLISGLTGLTEREIDVLAWLIVRREKLASEGLQDLHMSALLFSTSSRREICADLEISNYNLTNLFTALKKKKALHDGPYGDMILERLLPAKEIVITYTETEELDGTREPDLQEDSSEEQS